MPTDRDDLKAKLLAQAEAAIDKMLSDERLSQQMTMSEIEAVVGEPGAGSHQRHRPASTDRDFARAARP